MTIFHQLHELNKVSVPRDLAAMQRCPWISICFLLNFWFDAPEEWGPASSWVGWNPTVHCRASFSLNCCLTTVKQSHHATGLNATTSRSIMRAVFVWGQKGPQSTKKKTELEIWATYVQWAKWTYFGMGSQPASKKPVILLEVHWAQWAHYSASVLWANEGESRSHFAMRR